MPVMDMSGPGRSGAGRRGRKSRPALSYRRLKEPRFLASLRLRPIRNVLKVLGSIPGIRRLDG